MVYDGGAGVPISLFRSALDKQRSISTRAYKRENGVRDQVWIVFDEDEHDKISEVIERSKTYGIGVAYSNPCFELWLILHRRDFDSDCSRYEIQKTCEGTCEGYSANGGKVPDVGKLMPYIEQAEERAAAMVKRRKADGGAAPLTTVFELTRAMRSIE